MSRREYPVRLVCAEGGCGENITYVCESRAEEADCRKRNAGRPWKCSRHAHPERFLRPGNEYTEYVLIATRLPVEVRGEVVEGAWLPGLYWVPEDGSRSGSGRQHGPGFYADTREFPEGTRLTVTAQIELPENADA